MQSRAEVYPSETKVDGSRRNTDLDVPRPQALLGSQDMGVVCPGKLCCVSLTPPTFQLGKFLVLDGQIRAVIFFYSLQELWFSKTLLYVTSHSMKVSSLGCDFFVNVKAMDLSHQVS
jgi:hypothetical protein